MCQAKKQHLIDECKRVEKDAEYTAETHHIISARESRTATYLRLVPAIVSALSVAAILLGGHIWTAWFAMASGIASALYSVLDPERRSREHLIAAKSFTVVKHEARSLYATFSHFMDEHECYRATRGLAEKYNTVVELSPPTDNKAFEQARKRIKAGVHEPDPNKY